MSSNLLTTIILYIIQSLPMPAMMRIQYWDRNSVFFIYDWKQNITINYFFKCRVKCITFRTKFTIFTNNSIFYQKLNIFFIIFCVQINVYLLVIIYQTCTCDVSQCDIFNNIPKINFLQYDIFFIFLGTPIAAISNTGWLF